VRNLVSCTVHVQGYRLPPAGVAGSVNQPINHATRRHGIFNPSFLFCTALIRGIKTLLGHKIPWLARFGCFQLFQCIWVNARPKPWSYNYVLNIVGSGFGDLLGARYHLRCSLQRLYLVFKCSARLLTFETYMEVVCLGSPTFSFVSIDALLRHNILNSYL
jgi:hypothetical protein